jgi:hypothetical protein
MEPHGQVLGASIEIPAFANLQAEQVLRQAGLRRVIRQSSDIRRSTYFHSSTGKPVVFCEGG